LLQGKTEPMEELIIKKKRDAPEIICREGFVSMKGNSILADPKAFFQPVNDWIEAYIKDPAETTSVDLEFDYVDTASVQSVFSLLKLLKKVPRHEKRVVVNWHYEFDDPELLEVGEIMQTRLGLNFNFVEQTSQENNPKQ
jgi:hypothetical protein